MRARLLGCGSTGRRSRARRPGRRRTSHSRTRPRAAGSRPAGSPGRRARWRASSSRSPGDRRGPTLRARGYLLVGGWGDGWVVEEGVKVWARIANVLLPPKLNPWKCRRCCFVLPALLRLSSGCSENGLICSGLTPVLLRPRFLPSFCPLSKSLTKIWLISHLGLSLPATVSFPSASRNPSRIPASVCWEQTSGRGGLSVSDVRR